MYKPGCKIKFSILLKVRMFKAGSFFQSNFPNHAANFKYIKIKTNKKSLTGCKLQCFKFVTKIKCTNQVVNNEK